MNARGREPHSILVMPYTTDYTEQERTEVTALLCSVTHRQMPVTHEIDDLIEDLVVKVSALDDNAWDEGVPVPHSLINEWMRQLERVQRTLRNAGVAHPTIYSTGDK